jgi:hypothetical protein
MPRADERGPAQRFRHLFIMEMGSAQSLAKRRPGEEWCLRGGGALFSGVLTAVNTWPAFS